jgi:site-specific recombinase XerD
MAYVRRNWLTCGWDQVHLDSATLHVRRVKAGTPATHPLAESVGLNLKVHPHMLRHACGFKLANDGVDTRALQAYLGHRNIQHTVRYTELAPIRFQGFWKD